MKLRGIIVNKQIANKIKTILLDSIELNCEETKNIEVANWNNGNAHATMVAVLAMLDLFDTEVTDE